MIWIFVDPLYYFLILCENSAIHFFDDYAVYGSIYRNEWWNVVPTAYLLERTILAKSRGHVELRLVATRNHVSLSDG